MGQRASKLSAQDEQRLARKCNARRTALAGCRLANPDNAAACERLETALAMCYGAGARRSLGERGWGSQRFCYRRRTRIACSQHLFDVLPFCTQTASQKKHTELPAAAAAAAEHERCFTALMNTGHYNGRRDCAAELAALKAGVKKAGAAL